MKFTDPDMQEPTDIEVNAARWIGAAAGLLGKATFDNEEDRASRDELVRLMESGKWMTHGNCELELPE